MLIKLVLKEAYRRKHKTGWGLWDLYYDPITLPESFLFGLNKEVWKSFIHIVNGWEITKVKQEHNEDDIC